MKGALFFFSAHAKFRLSTAVRKGKQTDSSDFWHRGSRVSLLLNFLIALINQMLVQRNLGISNQG